MSEEKQTVTWIMAESNNLLQHSMLSSVKEYFKEAESAGLPHLGFLVWGFF